MFSTNFSHALHTPLNGIIGMTDIADIEAERRQPHNARNQRRHTPRLNYRIDDHA
ncbi:hypothetical protein [Zoogloea sp.]|uniref:hypothetical protein n=1 Tax=Zoogloea sp. TaxID=49181 RepID=UPI0035AE7077